MARQRNRLSKAMQERDSVLIWEGPASTKGPATQLQYLSGQEGGPCPRSRLRAIQDSNKALSLIIEPNPKLQKEASRCLPEVGCDVARFGDDNTTMRARRKRSSRIAQRPRGKRNIRTAAASSGLPWLSEHRNRLDLSMLSEDAKTELRRQFIAPEWKMDGHGRRVVESKADTKKRIKRSPDDADALNLAYAPSGLELPDVGIVSVVRESPWALR